MTDLTNTSFQLPFDPVTRKMDIGNVFRLTYRTFRQRPWTFIGLSLLPFVFVVLATGAQLVATLDKDIAKVAWVVFGIITIIQYVVTIVAYAAVIYGAARLLVGASFTGGEALRVGLRRFWPFLGLGILMGLIILAGLVLLIVPGVIAAFMLAAAIQVCVVEGLGPIASIKRSAFLTKGNKWRIFLSYLLTILVPIIVVYVVFTILSVVIVLGATAIFGQSSTASIAAVVISFLPMIPLFLVLMAVSQILLAVILVELRRVKEGNAQQEGVAQVFE